MKILKVTKRFYVREVTLMKSSIFWGDWKAGLDLQGVTCVFPAEAVLYILQVLKANYLNNNNKFIENFCLRHFHNILQSALGISSTFFFTCWGIFCSAQGINLCTPYFTCLLNKFWLYSYSFSGISLIFTFFVIISTLVSSFFMVIYDFFVLQNLTCDLKVFFFFF